MLFRTFTVKHMKRRQAEKHLMSVKMFLRKMQRERRKMGGDGREI